MPWWQWCAEVHHSKGDAIGWDWQDAGLLELLKLQLACLLVTALPGQQMLAVHCLHLVSCCV
jgi:hypothetical protein